MSSIPGQTYQYMSNPTSTSGRTSTGGLSSVANGFRGLQNGVRRAVGNGLSTAGSWMAPSKTDPSLYGGNVTLPTETSGSGNSASNASSKLPSTLTNPASSPGSTFGTAPSQSSNSATGPASSAFPRSTSLGPRSSGPPNGVRRIDPITGLDGTGVNGTCASILYPDGTVVQSFDLGRIASDLKAMGAYNTPMLLETKGLDQKTVAMSTTVTMLNDGTPVLDVWPGSRKDVLPDRSSRTGPTRPSTGPTSGTQQPTETTSAGTGTSPDSARSPLHLEDLAMDVPGGYGGQYLNPSAEYVIGNDGVKVNQDFNLTDFLTSRGGLGALDSGLSALYSAREWLQSRYTDWSGKSVLSDRESTEIASAMLHNKNQIDGSDQSRAESVTGLDAIVLEKLPHGDAPIRVNDTTAYPTFDELCDLGPEIRAHDDDPLSEYFAKRTHANRFGLWDSPEQEANARAFMNETRSLAETPSRRYGLSSRASPIIGWRVATAMMDQYLTSGDKSVPSYYRHMADTIAPRAARKIDSMTDSEYRSTFKRDSSRPSDAPTGISTGTNPTTTNPTSFTGTSPTSGTSNSTPSTIPSGRGPGTSSRVHFGTQSPRYFRSDDPPAWVGGGYR
ncbi:hypothetical protein IAR55_000337 [Kwoniella newhampshirensis]|uniref:Uncharacterized protein n=1 Tax=Kwoniella newhampshirensis TaxID=1651941 RepID=A0AAW0Z6B7_9TREE